MDLSKISYFLTGKNSNKPKNTPKNAAVSLSTFIGTNTKKPNNLGNKTDVSEVKKNLNNLIRDIDDLIKEKAQLQSEISSLKTELAKQRNQEKQEKNSEKLVQYIEKLDKYIIEINSALQSEDKEKLLSDLQQRLNANFEKLNEMESKLIQEEKRNEPMPAAAENMQKNTPRNNRNTAQPQDRQPPSMAKSIEELFGLNRTNSSRNNSQRMNVPRNNRRNNKTEQPLQSSQESVELAKYITGNAKNNTGDIVEYRETIRN